MKYMTTSDKEWKLVDMNADIDNDPFYTFVVYEQDIYQWMRGKYSIRKSTFTHLNNFINHISTKCNNILHDGEPYSGFKVKVMYYQLSTWNESELLLIEKRHNDLLL